MSSAAPLLYTPLNHCSAHQCTESQQLRSPLKQLAQQHPTSRRLLPFPSATVRPLHDLTRLVSLGSVSLSHVAHITQWIKANVVMGVRVSTCSASGWSIRGRAQRDCHRRRRHLPLMCSRNAEVAATHNTQVRAMHETLIETLISTHLSASRSRLCFRSSQQWKHRRERDKAVDPQSHVSERPAQAMRLCVGQSQCAAKAECEARTGSRGQGEEGQKSRPGQERANDSGWGEQ